LSPTKGLHSSETLFIVTETSKRLTWVAKSEHLADISSHEPNRTIYLYGSHRMVFKLEFDWQSLALTAGGLSFMA
jgi:hypothetical protein